MSSIKKMLKTNSTFARQFAVSFGLIWSSNPHIMKEMEFNQPMFEAANVKNETFCGKACKSYDTILPFTLFDELQFWISFSMAQMMKGMSHCEHGANVKCLQPKLFVENQVAHESMTELFPVH